MQLQRGEQQALALRGTAGNGSFHEKKLPRQKARQKLRVWQGVWLLPRSKPQAKCLFLQHLQPPKPALGVAFWVGTAEQRAEQAQPHPGASQLEVTHAHTSKEGASWQPGSPQHTWQGSECPAGPRDPSLCLLLTRQGQFWLCQSLGPMEKSGSPGCQ